VVVKGKLGLLVAAQCSGVQIVSCDILIRVGIIGGSLAVMMLGVTMVSLSSRMVFEFYCGQA